MYDVRLEYDDEMKTWCVYCGTIKVFEFDDYDEAFYEYCNCVAEALYR